MILVDYDPKHYIYTPQHVYSKDDVLSHNKDQERHFPADLTQQMAECIRDLGVTVADILRDDWDAEEDEEKYRNPCVAAIKFSGYSSHKYECARLTNLEFTFTSNKGEPLRLLSHWVGSLFDDYDGISSDLKGFVDSLHDVPDEFEFSCVYLNPEVFPAFSELYPTLDKPWHWS